MRYFKRAIMRFNPRTRVGCDATRRRQFSKKSWFQSTHPRGVRRSPHGGGGRGLLCFNPRTRVGCDQYGILFLEVIGCFNPRTRVGCDDNSRRPPDLRDYVSIHAPAWGATVAGVEGGLHGGGFNPRTRVGCDCFHVLSSRVP